MPHSITGNGRPAHITRYIQQNRKVSEFDIFERFKVGRSEMRKVIRWAQEYEVIISTTIARREDEMTYSVESQEQPKGGGV